MYVSIIGQQRAQMGEDAPDVRGIDMVEKAVYEDEVSTLTRVRFVAGDVDRAEFAAVTTASVLDVALVDVEAEIRRPRKVGGVGPRVAADVENPPHAVLQIVVSEDAGALGLLEWRQPQAVDKRPFQQAIGKIHRSYLT